MADALQTIVFVETDEPLSDEQADIVSGYVDSQLDKVAEEHGDRAATLLSILFTNRVFVTTLGKRLADTHSLSEDDTFRHLMAEQNVYLVHAITLCFGLDEDLTTELLHKSVEMSQTITTLITLDKSQTAH